MKIGFAITSSFCTLNQILDSLMELKIAGIKTDLK